LLCILHWFLFRCNDNSSDRKNASKRIIKMHTNTHTYTQIAIHAAGSFLRTFSTTSLSLSIWIILRVSLKFTLFFFERNSENSPSEFYFFTCLCFRFDLGASISSSFLSSELGLVYEIPLGIAVCLEAAILPLLT